WWACAAIPPLPGTPGPCVVGLWGPWRVGVGPTAAAAAPQAVVSTRPASAAGVPSGAAPAPTLPPPQAQDGEPLG
ncbi:MAG: hypothetical protein ACTHOR_11010, partial [Devosia sp.]